MRARQLLPLAAALALVLAGCLQPGGDGGLVGDEVTLSTLVAGLEAPVAAVDPDDGEPAVHVVEQAGRVRVWSPDGGLQAAPFLDLRGQVSTGFEQGLLGLAFPPDWPDERRVYASYTAKDGTSHIVRYQVEGTPPRADPGSEEVLLTLDQPYANHNGGHIAFGPAGYLWVGFGDGGSADDPHGNGQDVSNLYGTLLRLDVDTPQGGGYDVPHTNPLVGEPGRDEIAAYGLRNPWRFSFHDDAVWIGDVGQNQLEEVDRVPLSTLQVRAPNLGWSVFEGSERYEAGGNDGLREGSEHVAPVAEYDHELGCSITGGVVATDEALPAGVQGTYLFGDFCSGRVWHLEAVQDGYARTQLLHTDLAVSSFATLEDGTVLVVDRGGTLQELEAS